jgi:nanoRNase/pAp phosphatase (c-di-AMP/oligoRNAs hydrolase)
MGNQKGKGDEISLKRESLNECDKLRDVIQRGRRLVIFLHDYPDPDAIASGWILSRIGAHFGVRTRMVYGGRLGRAENRYMVELLKIPLHRINSHEMDIRKTDILAIVDAQPGTGNNSFPSGKFKPHIIIDHHPLHLRLKADFMAVSTRFGACTTLALKYFNDCNLNLDPALATAVAYAINSETQDFLRESTPADRAALVSVLPQVDMRTLAKIRHPRHEREYYRAIAKAMRNVVVSKNLCVCHIGSVFIPEFVSEIADLLKAMKGISWCLATGYHERERAMILSIRASRNKPPAGKAMQNIVRNFGRGGGHSTMAGGLALCSSLDEYHHISGVMTERFLRIFKSNPDHLQKLLSDRE